MSFENLRENLTAKVGEAKAKKIIDKLEKSYQSGKKGKDLLKDFNDSLAAEGIASDSSYDGVVTSTQP